MENQPQNETNNTLRRSEKIVLGIYLGAIAVIAASYMLPQLTQALHMGGLFWLALLVLPVLSLASFLNIFRLFSDRVPLFGRRTGVTVLVLTTSLMITGYVVFVLKDLLGFALWAMTCGGC